MGADKENASSTQAASPRWRQTNAAPKSRQVETRNRLISRFPVQLDEMFCTPLSCGRLGDFGSFLYYEGLRVRLQRQVRRRGPGGTQWARLQEKLDNAHALFNTTPAISMAKPIVDFSANAPPPPPSVGTAIPLSIEMHAVVLSLSFEMRAVANVKTKRPTYTLLQRLCRGNVPPRNYRAQDVGNASCLPRKVPPDAT